MKKSDIAFANNLVKGKIAETVFAQMLRSTGNFTVLEFGYEKIIPELVSRGKKGTTMVEALRTAPDFAVINNHTKEVHLIEVKYRKKFTKNEVFQIATRMSENWNPSFLFLATDTGFYFGDVKKIIERHGQIDLLQHPHISNDVQAVFLEILKKFEG